MRHFCANCKFCRLITTPEAAEQMIGCAKGQWKKPNGSEKLYKGRTITKRKSCPLYESMLEEPATKKIEKQEALRAERLFFR